MPNPTSRALHIDELLTDFSINYGPEIAGNFVASRASTIKRVDKESNYYPIWDKGDFFRIEMEKRADGATSVGSGQRMSTNTYFADVYALHTVLTDRQRSNADVEVELQKIRYLTHQAHLKRDSLFASEVFTTSVWSGFSDQAGVVSSPSTNQFIHWSDYTNGDPIGDITGKVQDLEVTAGIPGVRLVAVTNSYVFRKMAEHPDFLDRIKYTAGVERPASVTPEAMAAVLGLDEIIVAKAVQNTAKEGQTASMSRVFGNHFLLMYVADNAADDMPTACTTFSWSEYDQVTADGAAIFQWYEDAEKATYYEAEMAMDIKVTAADLGGFFSSCVA